jgi:hypothetical protein
MANISLTLYTNAFFGSILKSPIQMGSLSVNNSVTNISRLGTFNIFNFFQGYRKAFSWQPQLPTVEASRCCGKYQSTKSSIFLANHKRTPFSLPI